MPDEVCDRLAERGDIADDAQADADLVELADLLLERRVEELLEDRNLLRGPAPVLGAEREQGEVLHPALRAGPDDRANRLAAAAMPGDPRQQASPRPAPVAVHDDGDVARNRAGLGNDLGRALGHRFGLPRP